MMVRGQMRTDLVAAMRAQDRDRVMALRSALAAMDNAEAVGPSTSDRPLGEGEIAGASAGVGSTEADRRVLLPAEVRSILVAELTEREEAIARYVALGQVEAADRLRREAEALRPYLEMVES